MKRMIKRFFFSERTVAGRLTLAIYRVFTVALLKLALRHAGRNQSIGNDTRQRRILYIAASAPPYHTSGYTNRTHALVRAIQALSPEICVATRPGYPWDRNDRQADPTGSSTRVDEILYRHLPLRVNQRRTLRYIFAARDALIEFGKAENITAIHAASNHQNALPALLAARRLGIPFVYEMRGLWELSRISRQPKFNQTNAFKLGLALESLTGNQADHIFTISNQLRRYVTQHFNIPAAQISLLPNCADSETAFAPPWNAAPRPTIVYAGSLIEYEGLDTLLEAAAKLSAKGISYCIKIAGDGEMRDYLESLAHSLGISDNVEFLGKLSPRNAADVVSHSSLVCTPRKPYEVCKIVPPIKLVEAMSLGKPVLVPDLPVFRDEFGGEPVGLFFQSGDSEHLANVIETAFASPDEMRAMGDRARAYVKYNRTWPKYARIVLDQLTNLSNKRKNTACGS